MNSHARDLKRGDCLSPTDPALLCNPIDFIHEDHLREREICATLDRIAGADRAGPDDAAQVLEFLLHELPLHLQDEEEDLFPLLRRRCDREDDIGKAIDRLSSDHRHADRDTPDVTELLRRVEAGHAELSETEAAALRSFAMHARRHLILENAIILPFARIRLTPTDLETLRLRMLSRRGLDRLLETADAE